MTATSLMYSKIFTELTLLENSIVQRSVLGNKVIQSFSSFLFYYTTVKYPLLYVYACLVFLNILQVGTNWSAGLPVMLSTFPSRFPLPGLSPLRLVTLNHCILISFYPCNDSWICPVTSSYLSKIIHWAGWLNRGFKVVSSTVWTSSSYKTSW